MLILNGFTGKYCFYIKLQIKQCISIRQRVDCCPSKYMAEVNGNIGAVPLLCGFMGALSLDSY